MIERAGNELRLAGALTIASAVALCEEGKQQLNGDMVIDLAGVTEVDSTALSVLFEWRRTAREKNVQVSFRNLPDSMKSLAALYGVADLVAPGA
jgi:phospholipid transport system transporter-binding protein